MKYAVAITLLLVAFAAHSQNYIETTSTSPGNVHIKHDGKLTTEALDVINPAGTATLKIQGQQLSTSWRARLLLDRMADYRGAGVWIQASQGTENDWYIGVPYHGDGFTLGNHSSQPEYKVNSVLFVKPSGQIGMGTTTPVGNLEISANTTDATDLHITNTNAGGRAAVVFKEGSTTKAFLHYRGTASPSFANSVRLMTQSGTHADIYVGANGAHHVFISGGQNGVTTGHVGIGTTSPDEKLTVKGTVHAEEVKVELLTGSGPDYVFENDYQLPSLEEVKRYIDEHKHLPEVPSAKEMEENGVKVGEMNMILLKKVEELTLYTIELERKNAELVEMLRQMDQRISELEDRKRKGR